MALSFADAAVGVASQDYPTNRIKAEGVARIIARLNETESIPGFIATFNTINPRGFKLVRE